MLEAGETGGETGVGAEQLSVCTLQAGSVCSVDTGGVRRVSALSSVHLHGYVCVYACVCVRQREREGRWVGQTDQCGQVEDSHYLLSLSMFLSVDLIYLFIYSVLVHKKLKTKSLFFIHSRAEMICRLLN